MTLTADTADSALVDRLLKSSARQSYDPDVDVDWDAPPVPGLWWMQPERMSLYGTPLWDGLAEEQRIELSKHEIASIASVGLWFEIVLMQLLLKDVYRNDPRSARTHYELTEIADECRHSTMFGRAIGRFGVPAYGPRPAARRMGHLVPQVLRGASAYASTLIGEEPVDRWQRDMMHDERIQPMVRMISRIHVVEEARHVSFARDELEKSLVGITKRELKWHQFVVAQAAYVTMRSLVHPDVYKSVGIDPAVGRRAALGNPNYRATIAWMGEKMVPYLAEQGLIPESGRNRQTWHASFLLPKD
ncbi:diiron oxygenase [Nocardioides marmoriginsengisoli]|uniref:Diiron oxygenase n=1 Tax=Nocardioides marmoriginsengisoli TaxID=661483 RepID=A0A3N0CI67_9ACTN|nr:diiron oxygenase [Nocardioides marmoriginsengisoli]RNL63124.1 diiron oxygenase [Nocardioides marmoriginsengisoli]